MICAFHLGIRPRSANKKTKDKYVQMIGDAARRSYAGPLQTTALYSRIVWFHKYPTTEGDVDNIAKRVHDALKGVLFEDDHLISHTLAIRVDATRGVVIEPDKLYPEPSTKLAESLSDDSMRDILYIELGIQNDSNIYLGAIK